MSYIGNSPGVASQRVETTFTATASQTVFTPSSGYTLGYCDVYYNGVKLVNGDDYTAADGVSITLATAAAAGDSVVVVASFPRGLSDGYLKSEADAKYVAKTGSTMTGDLVLDNGSADGAQLTLKSQGYYAWNIDNYSGNFRWYYNSAEYMRVDAGGNFIVGDTSAVGKFNAVTASGVASFYKSASGTSQVNISQFFNSTNGAYLTVSAAGSSSAVTSWNNGSMVLEAVPYSSGNFILDAYTGALAFQTGRTEQGRFAASGEFLVGNTTNLGVGAKVAFVSPGNVLHIKSTSSGANNMVSYDSAGNPNFAISNGGAVSCASLNVNGSATVNDGILIHDSSGGGSLMKVRVERFGITATSGGATVSLGSGTRFTGFVIVAGEANDSASGVWHVVSDSEYDFDAITALATKGGAAYTGPATLAVSSVLAGTLRLTVTGSGYRVYNVMMIGNFG